MKKLGQEGLVLKTLTVCALQGGFCWTVCAVPQARGSSELFHVKAKRGFNTLALLSLVDEIIYFKGLW